MFIPSTFVVTKIVFSLFNFNQLDGLIRSRRRAAVRRTRFSMQHRIFSLSVVGSMKFAPNLMNLRGQCTPDLAPSPNLSVHARRPLALQSLHSVQALGDARSPLRSRSHDFMAAPLLFSATLTYSDHTG